jgi:2-polyprenyl-6-methoxyphenol hydroxylase-like FAD-dependent oxidoreductase
MEAGVPRVRVAVAGAGLGGLCLAQGLRRAGADVTVYERDDGFARRRQGYRLHVDARAGLALQQCLPPELLAAFQATCGQASTRLTVVSERLRVLKEVTTGDPAVDRYAPGTLSTSANRLTLREVLAGGLDDTIVPGSEVTGYDADGNGVRVHLADGREAEADVLVAADGVNSVVRRQYLPAAEPADTGGRCVYGKTPLRLAEMELLPAALDAGFTAVIGGRLGMATGLVRFRNRPEQVAGVRLSAAEDYLMWGLTGDRRQFGVPDERLFAMRPAELHALSAELIRSWHPQLRALHAMADIEETFAVRIRTSPIIAAWQPSRITVLGDAIHAMSPAGGSGANTALQDAAHLCRALTAAADGTDIEQPDLRPCHPCDKQQRSSIGGPGELDSARLPEDRRPVPDRSLDALAVVTDVPGPGLLRALDRSKTVRYPAPAADAPSGRDRIAASDFPSGDKAVASTCSPDAMSVADSPQHEQRTWLARLTTRHL